MRIEIAVFEGFDELDAVAPFEVLSNAWGDDVSLVGTSGPGEVVASHGLRVTCAAGLSGAADLVLVPGGGWEAFLRGRSDVYAPDRLPARLAQLHAAGARVASVCTGAMLLANAGLLRDRPATTHPMAFDALADTGALVDREARVVDAGDVLTAGGVTSGLDLALHLVEDAEGTERADAIAALVQHERRGPVRVVSPAG